MLKDGECWNDSNTPEGGRKVRVIYKDGRTLSGVRSDSISVAQWNIVKSWEYAESWDKAFDVGARALDTQEGGSHYKDLKIQPIEYIDANGLDYFQGNIVKYTTRHKAKNGAEDIKKAIHYCQLILELQYKQDKA